MDISKGEEIRDDEGREIAREWTMTVEESDGQAKKIEHILAFAHKLPLEAAQSLSGLVKISFASIDNWFEEDAAIYIHPKDPFKRIDILPSTRPIRVRVAGQLVAETNFAMHLYETGLPVRYYMPLTCIDPSVLRPSKTQTGCPYKGEAEYYSVEVKGGKKVEDCVWYYNTPLLESAKVEGLCCFYNEKVEIELDGVVLETPVSPFTGKKPGDKTA